MPKPIPTFRLFTLFSLSFLFGVGTASFISIDFNQCWLLLIFVFFLLLFATFVNFIFKNYLFTLSSAIFIFFLLGLSYFSYFDFRHQPAIAFGEKLSYQGIIINKPEIESSKQKAIVKLNSGDRILVTLPHYPYFSYGDKISFSGSVSSLDQVELLGYRKYLKKSLVVGTIAQTENINFVESPKTIKERFVGALYSISSSFEYSISRLYSEPSASLANGILLGSKENLPDDFNNDLSTTGLTHLVALSGYNITIVVVALTFLLQRYLNRRYVLLFSGFFVVLFVVLTGGAASAIRAAIFSLLILFGKAFGRKADFANLLILAAFCMVAINPYILVNDIGFQLSFLAFMGLVYISPILNQFFKKERYDFLPEYIKSPLIESCSAQQAVLPLIIYNFGRVSLIAPLANILVLWIIPYAMLVSLATGLFGIIYYPLGKIAVFLSWPFLEYVIKVPQFLARIPLAAIDLSKGVLWLEISLFLVLISSIYYCYRKFKLAI